MYSLTLYRNLFVSYNQSDLKTTIFVVAGVKAMRYSIYLRLNYQKHPKGCDNICLCGNYKCLNG